MTKINIISGFLGAGKTTFIKRLISDVFKGEKLVLIENEFGEIGVDGGFLSDSGIQINEMISGCICCSLVGDFTKALKETVDTYTPDRIIIEPSGVGKLSDVIAAVNNTGDESIVVDSCITVVDCTKAKMYLKNFGEFYRNQIENSGCVLLTRTDKAAEDKIESAIELIREINDEANIISTHLDKLSREQILEAFVDSRDAMEKELMEHALKHHHEHEHHHEHGEDCKCGCHDHHHHDHDEHEHHHEHGEDCKCGCHDHHHHDHDEHEHNHEHGEDCKCGCHDHHHHDHDEHEHHHEHGEDCKCGCHDHHHHDHDEHEHHHEHGEDCKCGCHNHHHHDHDEHEHLHEHGEDCKCGCHDHDHDHHHHHADETFTSWGFETARKYDKAELEAALDELDSGKFGTVLRAKGMVASADEWLYFDYVPEEHEVRNGSACIIGKICVIGAELDEAGLAKLFKK